MQWLLLTTDPSNLQWQNYLFAYGPAAGILAGVVWFFISGKAVPGRVYDQVVAEKEALNKQVQVMEANLRENVMPALTRSTDITLKSAELQGELISELRNLRRRS